MSILLWHELIGHAVLCYIHPKNPWNYASNANAQPPVTGWGTCDPVVNIENMARRQLHFRLRRPQYYN